MIMIHYDTSSTKDHVGIGIYFLFLSASTVANGVALYLLFNTKKKKVADLLLIHMCICESLAAMWQIVHNSLAVRHKTGQTLTGTPLNLVGEVVIFSSLYQIMICITIDRYLAVKLNLRYRLIVTKYRFFVTSTIIWTLSSLLGVLYALTSMGVYYVIWNVFDAITVATIIICYSYIIWTVHRQKCIFKINSSCRNQFRYHIPLWIGLTFIFLIFIPNLVLTINNNLYGVWFLVIFSFNYCCDPLIYVLSLYCERKRKQLVTNSSNNHVTTTKL